MKQVLEGLMALGPYGLVVRSEALGSHVVSAHTWAVSGSWQGCCRGCGGVLSSDPQKLLWRYPGSRLSRKRRQPVHLSLLGITFQKLVKLHCSRGKLCLLIEERKGNNRTS